MTERKTSSILFVCLGNICRSPLAEGVFRHVATARNQSGLRIDSAGTSNWHVGDPPDPRSMETAGRYGIDLSEQVCRQVSAADFEEFDLILAMDRANLARLHSMAPAGHGARIQLFLDAAHDRNEEIPDPYYGGPDGFDSVYRTVLTASEALLSRVVSEAASGQASSTT